MKGTPDTIGAALRELRTRLDSVTDRPDQEARWIAGQVLDRDNAGLRLMADEAVSATAWREMAAIAARRATGTPLPYCLGRWAFRDLELLLSPDVLIPRPDTEILVDAALRFLPQDTPARVADLGTGSGAVALAIAKARPRATVYAVDHSPRALKLARENGVRLGLAVWWLRGHWCAPLAGEPAFDVIVANPPYLAEDDPHLPELLHEPREALVAGPTGLEAIQAISDCAPSLLRHGGGLFLEHGWEQGAAVRNILADAGMADIVTLKDLAGRERVSGGVRKAPDA